MAIASPRAVHSRNAAHRIRDLTSPGGLSAFERKVAMMSAAGATQDSIAYMMESNQSIVRQVLARPAVADLVVLLTIKASEGLQEPLQDLNKRIEHVATEAFGVELDNMRELQQMAGLERWEDKPGVQIKARMSATQIAQDILDRAGKRAPTRVVQTHVGMRISDEAVERLVRVAEELHPTAIDVTDVEHEGPDFGGGLGNPVVEILALGATGDGSGNGRGLHAESSSDEL